MKKAKNEKTAAEKALRETAPSQATGTVPRRARTSTAAPRKAKEKKKSRHPWRENIEALAMAIVVALLFKSFILEISKIPSGSMQPTLMGETENRVFDRVLVDKLSFSLRDPKRWEIVVFKHPLENSRIMVKRLVGMPGESLRVAGGDLWTRTSEDEEWRILRRPEEVQEEMWRRIDVEDPGRSSWSRAEGTSGWHIQGRDITAKDRGKAIFKKDSPAIRDHYLDGYPDSLRNKIRVNADKSERNDVGDLRLTGRLRTSDATAFVRFELTEGTRTYAFVLPGPAGDAAAPSIQVTGDTPATAAAAEGRLPADDWIPFAVENLDDRLSLSLDGEEVAALEIDSHTGRGSGVSLAMEGGEVLFEDLMVERDIHYVGFRPPRNPRPMPTWEVQIPEGSYVMLGDNTQDSADSRDWRAQRFTWTTPEGEMSVVGNFRGDPENPTQNRDLALTRFRDEWGEEHWIERGTGGAAAPEFKSPLVRRQLIQGRALAVFWPIKPHRGLWRLGWLH